MQQLPEQRSCIEDRVDAAADRRATDCPASGAGNRMVYGLGLLLVAPIAAASREGAGIGKGMALLFYGVLLTVALVIAVAVVSGILIGYRRGGIGRRVGLHLLYALGFLITTPIVILVSWEVRKAFEWAALERQRAVTEAWLAPLEQPATGDLEHALGRILDAEEAETRLSYLILALPGILDRIEIPLDDRDRAAVQAAARRLRSMNAQLDVGSHPSNLDRLDASANWLLNKPDLLKALQDCTGRQACTQRVIELADDWCYRRLETCRAVLDPARLEAAEVMVKADRSTLWKLQQLRLRAHGD